MTDTVTTTETRTYESASTDEGFKEESKVETSITAPTPDPIVIEQADDPRIGALETKVAGLEERLKALADVDTAIWERFGALEQPSLPLPARSEPVSEPPPENPSDKASESAPEGETVIQATPEISPKKQEKKHAGWLI